MENNDEHIFYNLIILSILTIVAIIFTEVLNNVKVIYYYSVILGIVYIFNLKLRKN
ncbi:hypothetical protein [Alkaliphilus sp. B6464]|uniref:hypothetical protein n=1 Tax=Alkaliphilus sp. B6464 TaxID=2731219 RepID=UPI001BA5CD1D|nr:hypothetical protein [Alkaliphilus sp. B6464]QUH19473.1 hypothetical protein HYG84_05945 [Alkaliphilus sp. B6464]